MVINFFTSIPYITLVLSGAFVCTAFCYYNSRYRDNLKASSVLFTITLTLLLLINFFFNSGVKGTTLILFMMFLIFTIALIPRRQYKLWIPLYIFCILFLIGHELIFPGLIIDSYSSRMNLFIDTGFTYLSASLCITAVLIYILKSYREEKNKAWAASIALKEANDAKTKLLSILSHDLNSPLNSIQGFLELLIDMDFNEDEERSIKQTLLKETKSTQAMLINLLSWTKSQMDGGIKISLVPVNILNTLEVLIENLRSIANEKMISINHQIDPEICILADVDMLKLVVRNLLNNAIKFTNPGGEIWIKIELKATYARLLIEDNGLGISFEKQKQLFSLNTRTTYGTHNEKGMGMGLLLCKEFTEMQGGKISFTSVPGKGTVFSLDFPLCHPLIHNWKTKTAAKTNTDQ